MHADEQFRTALMSRVGGRLFTEGFLCDRVSEMLEWSELDDATVDRFESRLQELWPTTDWSPNETQTERVLIWPLLECLGWSHWLEQEPLGSDSRPDGLLFCDQAKKELAEREQTGPARYRHGNVIVEAKKWRRPLDRAEGSFRTPSSQMLRYMLRAQHITENRLRWGILTNGCRWRLYYSGADSISEEFFEFDLDAAVSSVEPERCHSLKMFLLMFRHEAFQAGPDGRSFHLRAIAEGQFEQQRITRDLARNVFDSVFPDLTRALAEAAPQKPLTEVRNASLILLFRLLFILYAEDRHLLPVNRPGYRNYSLRHRLRQDIGRRKNAGEVFSRHASVYWCIISEFCQIIGQGDDSIGLPAYNGGLFDCSRTPLLNRVNLSDAVVADVIDKLSFEVVVSGRRYINYRDLGVRQLGSIYEQLLEHEVVRDDTGQPVMRLGMHARKDTGSYYTPANLVRLVVEETLDPLVQAAHENFAQVAQKPDGSEKTRQLHELDPATRLLNLKICDPAMGSGHFLVYLVDYLADRVIAALDHAAEVIQHHESPLGELIAGVREMIVRNAKEGNWYVDPDQLDDRHIIRRMVLKCCIYGVDRNPLAVELTKVSLWLHTLTAGAPLSFLDHHLRCGDSLFGSWVDKTQAKAGQGRALFLDDPIHRALATVGRMQEISTLTDAELEEAQRSASLFRTVEEKTKPLNCFMSMLMAFEWMQVPRDGKDGTAIEYWLDGMYGDPVDIALNGLSTEEDKATNNKDARRRFVRLRAKALSIIEAERFLHWQVTFPGVWFDWESGRTGGFDAIVGNPPWDRIELQRTKWFEQRRPEIARASNDTVRRRMIAQLEQDGDPLHNEYNQAYERSKRIRTMARNSGDYPLLAGTNLYSLFVERAIALVHPGGMIGLLTPSGIAGDKNASQFFSEVATSGRLKSLYDFQNKGRDGHFFPDVDNRFKFCAFIASPSPLSQPARLGFFLDSVADISDPDRCFSLTPADFARVNPNTRTAPVFRSRRDAELTAAIYARLPVLVDRAAGQDNKAWPVLYSTMFQMSNDSSLFRTVQELEEEESAFPVTGNRYDSPNGEWVPLYEGKMVQAYDHRAAGITVDPTNLHRQGQKDEVSGKHKNPDWSPLPRYWVRDDTCNWPSGATSLLAFKDVTSPTNSRTMIAAMIPRAGAGHTLPLLVGEDGMALPGPTAVLCLANLNSLPFDYVARQKVPGVHLSKYIVEQLPVVPPERYGEVQFGSKTAAEIVNADVLELTYTARDMASFAQEMGLVNADGIVREPFRWDEERRRQLRTRLDAVHFHLYGITERDEVRYVYSTFSSIPEADCDMCLAWMNALDAGQPDADIRG